MEVLITQTEILVGLWIFREIWRTKFSKFLFLQRSTVLNMLQVPSDFDFIRSAILDNFEVLATCVWSSVLGLYLSNSIPCHKHLDTTLTYCKASSQKVTTLPYRQDVTYSSDYQINSVDKLPVTKSNTSGQCCNNPTVGSRARDKIT